MKLAFPLPGVMRMPALMQPWEAHLTGADVVAMARRADELGFDMIAVPEHFLIPADQASASGAHWLHSTTAQAFLAGATKRIALNSCVSILPAQHPVVTAKALATADWLSGGRMMVTFGVGWLAAEFDALGVPFSERGRRADEYLAAMVTLWTSDAPAFDGHHVSFRDVVFEPKPVQRPHLPVWIGGDADAALRRVARFGSGWWPFLTDPAEFPAKLDRITSHPDYDGRPLDVMYGLATSRVGAHHETVDSPVSRPGRSAEELVDRLGRLTELGVTASSVPAPRVAGVEGYLDYAQWVIEEVRPKLP
ncbi:TIGR03619 family F420-dependent LLM class oxidoreductase [Mycobacterium sp. MYCO198283]|uniref:TIGR03619 family F420-dependent LLM class oxidoreductase n=1 Tax=Mycobacterium sp. MYCO198283 TaxID=2883505 RepID=UPI001E5F25CB|nr:TIGR03619 family F420-dependent LLM class oxidoreductase [Mycobacterium sp. MYCO198283]MCG5434292.1 TIGR03619 family F420-dependent LLM class oxidoreductase [Mycobacterium sp. MYCO198283]